MGDAGRGGRLPTSDEPTVSSHASPIPHARGRRRWTTALAAVVLVAATSTAAGGAALAAPLPSLDGGPGGLLPLDPSAPLGLGPDEDEVVWLCRPGLADDPCEVDLDTTVREPDGSEQVVTPEQPPAEERPVDCFYVYPTVSNQPTASSDRRATPEVRSIATYQAARFSSVCRVFAPVYRQRTVPALLAEGTLGVPLQDAEELREIAYADVLTAWRAYLDETPADRGVVLLGHSQGASLLRLLLQREIEPDAQQRERLTGAVLLGSSVLVPAGGVVGGDLDRIPLCTAADEPGCVITYASFAEDPPADSRFGRAPTAAREAGLEVGCVDPGALLGDDQPFGVTLPSEPFAPGFIALTILQTNGGPPPTADTTWVTAADRFTGGCARIGDAHVLRYDPEPGSTRPNPSPDDTWGTHIVDVNLGYDRLVELVARQAAAAGDLTDRASADVPTSTERAAEAAADRDAPAAMEPAGRPLPATGGTALALALLSLGAAGALGGRRRP